jgi:hypothetical protein
VFNGSENSSNGVSLNHILMTGPKVQDDLFDIVQRFWLQRIVMSADVEKMYQQIWVHPDDRCLQRILWRKTPDQPITTYQLNTVVYGTASAPFLATGCLQQLIEDEKGKGCTGSLHLGPCIRGPLCPTPTGARDLY